MRAAEQKLNQYDPALGPRRGSGLRGEEITLIKRMLADGAEGRWVPHTEVRHFIPAQRQTLSYVREWYRGWGKYLAHIPSEHPQRYLLGRPLVVWREVIETELRYRYRKAVGKPEEWMEDLKAASTAWGRLHASV